MTKWGPIRRAFAAAKRDAWWLEDTDRATVRAAEDLADRLDTLRRATSMFGDSGDTKAQWHAAAVHRRFLDYLVALRMTPDTRPASEPEGDGLLAALREAAGTN